MIERDEGKMRRGTIIGITLSAVWLGMSIHALDILGLLGMVSFVVACLIGAAIFLAGLVKGGPRRGEPSESAETT